jgi:uncharacterized phiE125 gp8 family phage protein
MAKLKIKTEPAVEPVDLDSHKTHCRIDGSGEDLLLQSLHKAARQYVELMCGPLITQTWYQYEDKFPDGDALVLQLPNVQSVTSLKYTDEDNNETTFSTDNYSVDLNDNYDCKLVLKPDKDWPTDTLWPSSAIEIEFIAGYGDDDEDVPELLRSVIKLLVAHWYEERQPVAAFAGISTVIPIPLTVDHLISNYRYWRRDS